MCIHFGCIIMNSVRHSLLLSMFLVLGMSVCRLDATVSPTVLKLRPKALYKCDYYYYFIPQVVKIPRVKNYKG